MPGSPAGEDRRALGEECRCALAHVLTLERGPESPRLDVEGADGVPVALHSATATGEFAAVSRMDAVTAESVAS